MSFLTALGAFNYGLVLIYGLFLSAAIAGGWENRRQKRLIIALCPLFLLIQTPCWLILGEGITKQLYPLIVHLPLVLILILALKKPMGIALVSVCTAYLCCQLPRWVNLMVTAVTGSSLAGEISYTLLILPIFLLLRHLFVHSAYGAMTASAQSLLLFGSLPVAYYFYDYATVVYADALSTDIQALNEFLPTALIIFYVMFLSAYHKQMQTRADAELQRSMLEAELKQAEEEFTAVKQLVLLQEPMKGRFTKTHLLRIHRFLFEDVYPFAGHIRREQISKGDTLFYPPEMIDRQLGRVFDEIHTKKLLSEQDSEKQIQNLSHVMTELNIIHPFREGNGRSIRELIRCMGLEYGLRLNWGNTDRDTLIDAAIASVDDDMAFCDVLTQCLETEE